MAPDPLTETTPIAMKLISLASVGAIGIAAAIASICLRPGLGGLIGAGFALLMLAIAAADFRYFIIPDELTVSALALAIAQAALSDTTSIVDSLAVAMLRAAITMGFFLAIRQAYRRLRQREGIGLGDVKLAFVAGAWLNWTMIPVAIELAALAALLTYAGWKIFSRRPLDAASRMPFGLFFAPAIWVTWLLNSGLN